MLGSMSRKPKPPPDDPAESERFIDMARELGADESATGREAFDRAFRKVAVVSKEPPKPLVRRSRRNEKPASS